MRPRGIVVSPNFRVEPDTGVLVLDGRMGFDPLDLRQYILYWDRIEYPDNNMISIGSSPDVEFLISAGVITRTRFLFRSWSGPPRFAYLLAQLQAFRKLEAQQPGQWALAQPGMELILPPGDSEVGRVAEVELYKSLPIPPEDVPFADILSFKEKRTSELLALRAYLDDLYAQIVSSQDIPRSKEGALLKVESALSDLHKAANESWRSKLLSSLKVEINLANIAPAALVGAGAGVIFGATPELGAIIGTMAAALKLELKAMRKPVELPENIRAFAFVHHVDRELKG